MARAPQMSGPGTGVFMSDPSADAAALANMPISTTEPMDKDKVLPLPGWLKKAYFIFPVVLYVPDAIFNFYVYSDGASIKNPNPVIQVGQIALWAFLSIGVVGMAYLLSVLAPWHWGQGHRIQAFFCALGVVIATAITTWNSLAYRSTGFSEFPTDRWAYGIWPQLQASSVSLTMVLVAIAPPFWGLFWAIVQPTETGRSLRQLQESHAERLLRMQQEAELKRIKAETNAKIREAQLRGMAQTAAAARDQAKTLLTQKRDTQAPASTTVTPAASPAGDTDPELPAAATLTHDETDASSAPNVLQLHNLAPMPLRTPAAGRDASAMYNHAATSPAAHAAPAMNAQASTAQSALFNHSDVSGTAGRPASDAVTMMPQRTPPMIGRGIQAFFPAQEDEPDGMTGTTGPRPAVRRPGDSGMLRLLNEGGLGRIENAMQEAARELNPTGVKSKAVPARELVARVAEKLGVDEAAARSAIQRVRDAQKARRGQ